MNNNIDLATKDDIFHQVNMNLSENYWKKITTCINISHVENALNHTWNNWYDSTEKV